MTKQIATGVSEYAEKHMAPSDLEQLKNELPCEVTSTDEKSQVDDSYLLELQHSNELVHPDMLVIKYQTISPAQ